MGPRGRIVKGSCIAVALGLLALGVPGAIAQQPPIPSEPVYPQRQYPMPQPYDPPAAQTETYRQRNAYPRPALSPQQQRCMQLEQELANNWMRSQQSQTQLPQIEAEIRKYDQIFQGTQAQAERSGCYQNVFIFGRALVRTPRCLALNDRIEDARRQLARLQEQRERISRGTENRQDDVIAALARNGCGEQYEREARRREPGFFGWLGGQPVFEAPRRDVQTSRIVPFATYRTLCVRTCDGYYFPISYSTLPSQFPNDAAACQQRCAAPAELYVYRNPGEEVEQMVSLDGRAYNDLPTAWRYRKEYVKGCSCKQVEYDPTLVAQSSAGSAAEPTASTTRPR